MPDITQKLGFDASGATRSLTSLTGKLNEANTALAKFQGTAGKSGALGNVTKNTEKAKKGANELTASWKTMARVIQTQMVVRGFNTLIQSMKQGVESARELGLAVAEVQTISGRTQSNEALTASIVEMSSALSSTPLELTEGLYQTLSNQVVETGEALQFTATASRLATVTASETGDAVNALASVMNSYGLEAEQTEHIAGTLFKTVELGRLRLSEIANVIGRVTPLTAAMGVTWEETAASIAVMTRSGVRADTAITQLRAVMTKLIKPTDEVREIFHQWGVRDGKQAIETFGGLGGVLKKLSEETGGTSEGMADLLRRVRAIVGQMGIMTNDGQDLADTMEAITGATEEATDAWAEFVKTPAQKLTLEMQKFENRATVLGTKLIPALNEALSLVNFTLGAQSAGWDQIFGGISVATKGANTYAEEVTKAENQIAALSKQYAEDQRERYKGLAQAAAQYYTFANKEEFTLAAIRDDSITQATATMEAAGKQVLDFYASSIKGLEKAVQASKSVVMNAAKEIAGIQQTIDSNRLQIQLDNAKTAGEKLAILAKKTAEASAKGVRDFASVDATKESKAQALASTKATQELIKQSLAIAKQEGNQQKIKRLQQDLETSYKNQQQVIDKHASLSERAGKAAEKELGTRKENLGTLKELVKEQSKLRGDRAGADPTQEAAIDARLEAIGGKITDILISAENGSAFLQSLGLDKNFDVISAGLRDALNQADIDWKRHVAEAKAAFAQAVIPIRVELGTGEAGVKGRAAEAFGLEKGPKETEADFARRIDEKALKIDQQRLDVSKQITDERILGAAGSNTAARAQAEATKLLKGQLTDLINGRALLNGLAVLGLSTEDAKVKAAELNTASIEKQRGQAVRLHETLVSMAADLERNGTLTEGQVQLLRESNTAAFEGNQLTAEQRDINTEIIKGLEKRAESNKRVNEITAQAPNAELTKNAEAVIKVSEAQKEAGLDNVQAEKQVGEGIQRNKVLRDQLLNSTKQTSAETANTATQAGSATTNVAAIGTAAGTASTGVASISTALDGVIAKAKIAAAAVAAIGSGGGGAVAYHGGPMNRYFAAGGSPRGQDKISTMLSRGETVVNSKNSKRFYSELNAMNQGSQPVFREQGGQVTNVGDVNVTVNGGDSSQQTIREIGHGLRREFQRGNIKLR